MCNLSQQRRWKSVYFLMAVFCSSIPTVQRRMIEKVLTIGGAGIRRFRPQGGHKNRPFRGYDYMIPHMTGKLALSSVHFTRAFVK